MKMPPTAILPQLPPHGKLVQALWLLTLGGLLLYVAFTIHLCLLALGYPYQLDYGEGLVLHQALLLAEGQSIYKSLDSYPYIFSNYPPLFQAAISPWLAIFGVSFFPGRLLALGATIGLTGVLYSLARRAGAGRLAAAVAAMLFLGSPYIYNWAPLVRIDLPALFLTTLGVLVLSRASVRTEMTTDSVQRSGLFSSRRPVYLAALLFVLALYTKQSYLAAPVAAAVYLALNDRAALRHFVAALLIAGLAPFVAIERATGGAFSFGLFTANVNPFSATLLLSQVQAFAATFAVIILLAVLAFAYSRRLAQPSTDRLRIPLLGWYSLFAVAAVLLAGKVGAWQNYFFEALFVLCVAAGLGLDHLLRNRRRALHLLAPLSVVVQLVLLWHDPAVGVRVINEDGAANRVLAPLIARQTGMVLSEDLGLLIVNGREIPYFSFQYAQLASVGRWDQHWELENLRAGRFALVVLEKGTRENPDRYQRFTRDVLSTIDVAYGLVAEVGKYRVYAPQPMLRQTDVNFGDSIALLGYRIDAVTESASANEIVIPDPTPAIPLLNPYPTTLRVTLLWQARQPVQTDYKVFVHFEDAAGQRYTQSDGLSLHGLYPPRRWATGEIVRDDRELTLPAGLAAGRYTVRIGLYDPRSDRRLPLSDGRDSLVLASLPVAMDVPAPAPVAEHRFANGAALSSYEASPLRLAAGGQITVTLHWQTERYLDQDYTVFVHLVQNDGRPLAQGDSLPQGGAYPTSLWNPGEGIKDVHIVSTPVALPPGDYQLLVGLYHQPTGRRVPLTGGGDSIPLDQISIVN